MAMRVGRRVAARAARMATPTTPLSFVAIPIVRTPRMMSGVAQPQPSPFAAPPTIQKAAPPVQNPLIAPAGAAAGQWRVVRYTGGRASVSGIVATVFGATGFLGRYVVNILGKMGSQVVIPYRGEGMNARHLKLSGDLGQIVPVPYSLYDKDTVLRAMARSNVVINLIGSRHTTKNFDLHDVNVKTPLRLAQLAREAGVERFIHVSALGAQTKPGSDLSQYLLTKSEGEAAVRSIYPEATILRPGPIFGAEDSFVNRTAKICRFWGNTRVAIPMFGNEPTQHLQPIHVADVAHAIFNSIALASSQGVTYDLGGLDVFTGRELYDLTIKEIYRSRTIVHYGEKEGMALAWGLEKLPQFRFRMWTQDMLATARTNLVNTKGNPEGLTELGISNPGRLEAHISNLLLVHRGMFGPRPGMLVVDENIEYDNPLLINNPDYNPEAMRIRTAALYA